MASSSRGNEPPARRKNPMGAAPPDRTDHTPPDRPGPAPTDRPGPAPPDRPGPPPPGRPGPPPPDRPGPPPPGRPGPPPPDRPGPPPPGRPGRPPPGRSRPRPELGRGRPRPRPAPRPPDQQSRRGRRLRMRSPPKDTENAGEAPREVRNTKPPRKDLIFMVVVWSTELTKTVFTMFEDRITHDKFVAPEDPSNELRFVRTVQIACISVLMIAMSIVDYFFNTYRMYLLIGGLAVYLLFPVTGLLFAVKNAHLYGKLMMTFGCLWWVVHPIRFLLIFHQFYPIRLLNVRQISTRNMVAIWLVEYLSSYIMYPKRVAPKAYMIGWSISGVGLIAWIGALLYLRKNQNKSPDKLQTVNVQYSFTEVAARFRRSQNIINIILLLLLLVSYLIFPVLKTSLSIVRRLITKQLRGKFDFLAYRLDLIITIVVAIVVDVVSKILRNRRNEKFEMIVIAGALIFNIIFLLVLKPMVNEISSLDKPDEFNLRSKATVFLNGLPFDEKNPSTYVTIKGLTSKTLTQNSYNVGPWQQIVMDVPTVDHETVPVEIISEITGEALYKTEIEIFRDELLVFFYVYEGERNFNGKFVLVDIDMWDRWTETKFYFVYWNANMPRCHDGYHEASIKALNASKTWNWEGAFSHKIDVRRQGEKVAKYTCFPFKPVLYYPGSGGIAKAESTFPLIFPESHDKTYASDIICSKDLKDGWCVPSFGIELENDVYVKSLASHNIVTRTTLEDKDGRLCRLPTTLTTKGAYPAAFMIMYWNIEPCIQGGIFICFGRPLFPIHSGRKNPPPPVVTTPFFSGIVYGVATAGVVSYIVLLWILSPIKWRPFILYGFFLYEVLCERCVKIFVTNITEKIWNILLGLAVFAFSFHVSVAIFWWQKIKIPLPEKEDPDKRY